MTGTEELLERTLAWRVSVLPSVVEVSRRGLSAHVRLAGRPGERVAVLVAAAARRRGVRLRATGDVVVLHAPRSVSDPDLCRLVAVLASSIAEVAIRPLPAAA